MKELIIIAFVIVAVYDYLDFTRELFSRICSLIFKRNVSVNSIKLPKLLECSLCMTFWTTLIYQLFMHQGAVLEKLAISMIIALCTPYIYALMKIINNAVMLVFGYIEHAIDRLGHYLVK